MQTPKQLIGKTASFLREYRTIFDYIMRTRSLPNAGLLAYMMGQTHSPDVPLLACCSGLCNGMVCHMSASGRFREVLASLSLAPNEFDIFVEAVKLRENIDSRSMDESAEERPGENMQFMAQPQPRCHFSSTAMTISSMTQGERHLHCRRQDSPADNQFSNNTAVNDPQTQLSADIQPRHYLVHGFRIFAEPEMLPTIERVAGIIRGLFDSPTIALARNYHHLESFPEFFHFVTTLSSEPDVRERAPHIFTAYNAIIMRQSLDNIFRSSLPPKESYDDLANFATSVIRADLARRNNAPSSSDRAVALRPNICREQFIPRNLRPQGDPNDDESARNMQLIPYPNQPGPVVVYTPPQRSSRSILYALALSGPYDSALYSTADSDNLRRISGIVGAQLISLAFSARSPDVPMTSPYPANLSFTFSRVAPHISSDFSPNDFSRWIAFSHSFSNESTTRSPLFSTAGHIPSLGYMIYHLTHEPNNPHTSAAQPSLFLNHRSIRRSFLMTVVAQLGLFNDSVLYRRMDSGNLGLLSGLLTTSPAFSWSPVFLDGRGHPYQMNSFRHRTTFFPRAQPFGPRAEPFIPRNLRLPEDPNDDDKPPEFSNAA